MVHVLGELIFAALSHNLHGWLMLRQMLVLLLLQMPRAQPMRGLRAPLLLRCARQRLP